MPARQPQPGPQTDHLAGYVHVATCANTGQAHERANVSPRASRASERPSAAPRPNKRHRLLPGMFASAYTKHNGSGAAAHAAGHRGSDNPLRRPAIYAEVFGPTPELALWGDALEKAGFDPGVCARAVPSA